MEHKASYFGSTNARRTNGNWAEIQIKPEVPYSLFAGNGVGHQGEAVLQICTTNLMTLIKEQQQMWRTHRSAHLHSKHWTVSQFCSHSVWLVNSCPKRSQQPLLCLLTYWDRSEAAGTTHSALQATQNFILHWTSLIQGPAHKLAKALWAGSCTGAPLSWCYHPHSPWSLLGCLGSTATRTIGVASKLRGVNGGQAGDVDSVADLSTKSCRPPIPNRNWGKKKAKQPK